MEVAFNRKLSTAMNRKGCNTSLMCKQAYYQTIHLIKMAKSKKTIKMPSVYYRLKKYDIVTIAGEERLISPGDISCRFYLYREELFDVLHQVHLTIGHRGRDKMKAQLKCRYKNVTQEAVMIYLKLCKVCQKKSK